MEKSIVNVIESGQSKVVVNEQTSVVHVYQSTAQVNVSRVGVQGPAGVTLHESLTDLLGGATNDHYHLTQAQRDDLTDGGNTTLHIHDSRYYTETEIDVFVGGKENTGVAQGLINAHKAASGEHSLSILTQSGATTNQVPQWNGSAWVPVTFSGGGGTWGSITGTLSNQTDLQTALNAKVNLSGDTMTGDLTVPNINISDNNIRDNGNIDSIAVSDRELKDSGGNLTVAWNDRMLSDPSSGDSLSWSDRKLFSPGGTEAIDWQNRELKDSSGSVSINFDSPSGPTTLTQSVGDNSERIATTAHVNMQSIVNALIFG